MHDAATAAIRRTEECANACLECYKACLDHLTHHCVEVGGPHTEPAHVRLMMDCIEICRACADFCVRNTANRLDIGPVCEKICRACAEHCERLTGMEKCVAACRRCADTCLAL